MIEQDWLVRGAKPGLQESRVKGFGIAATQRGGRPTKYTPGLVRAIAQTMGAGLELYRACALFNVHRSTVWLWGLQHQDVRAIINKGKEWRKQERERVRKELFDGKMPRRRPKKIRSVRPRKYRDEFVLLVRPTLRETARAIGVDPDTIWEWSRKHRRFGDALMLKRMERWLARHEANIEQLVKRSGLDMTDTAIGDKCGLEEKGRAVT
jgi:hypothetical protein